MKLERPLPRSAALIVNVKSRKGRDMFRAAGQKLKAAGITITTAQAIRDPRELPARVQEAIEAGAPMVIVGGGDGSLSCSVDMLVGHDVVFALLPLGTANSFARTLDIPLDLDGAIEVIAKGRRRRVDLGMIDRDYYANCATIGLAPLVAETIPHGIKRWLGRPGYLAWAMIQLIRFKPFRVTVGEGPAAETIDALEVRIANGPYHGGAEVVDDAEIDSGEIVVQAVVGRSYWQLGWSWLLTVLRHDARRQTTASSTAAHSASRPIPRYRSRSTAKCWRTRP